jgi:uncharacterized membrane protein YtjA (UPF0391 family)
MLSTNDKRPHVIASTAPPTAEHRKADRDGRIALGVAVACLLVSIVAGLLGFGAVALTSAGVCVALIVVGLMLHYEGQRQQQRPDPLQPGGDEEPAGTKSTTFNRT